ANITPASLTVTGIVANNKVYDGNANATISNSGSLNGPVVIGDAVSLVYTPVSALFSDKNVANGKTVTVTSYSLTGADSGNYSLSPSQTTTANITPASLTVT